MSTRQVLFALLACVAFGFGYAPFLQHVPPIIIACMGKTDNHPCKLTLAGVEVDGICTSGAAGVG
jgi:hypothetical protein